MKRFYLCLAASALSLFPYSVSAQESSSESRVVSTRIDKSYRANPQFNAMVRAATTHMSDTFRFGKFRSIYVDTRQYDPIGDAVVDKMQTLAYHVQTEKDLEKQSKALEDYRTLVMSHLANLRVVVQALSLSKLDKRFGSPNFFVWLRKGIMRDVLAHGDGLTLRAAYNIITMSEETALIGQLGYRVLDTQSANEGGLHYNMHDVEDIWSGQKNTLFVNTSRPLGFIESLEKEEKTYRILRQ